MEMNVPPYIRHNEMELVGAELLEILNGLHDTTWTGEVVTCPLKAEIHFHGKVLECAEDNNQNVVVQIHDENDNDTKFLTSTGPEDFVLDKREYTLTAHGPKASQVLWEPGHLTSAQVAHLSFESLKDSANS
jgi:hypothetical protein